MFKKLLKYEFKSVGKWYLGLYGLVLGLSVVLGFWIQSMVLRSQKNMGGFAPLENMNGEGWLFFITILIFAFIIAGLMISTFILVIRRFYQNVYGKQGYLTMTLPVNSHQIILSKLLAAFIWYILTFITFLLSIFIIIAIGSLPEIQTTSNAWKALFEGLSELFGSYSFPYAIFSYIISLISAILLTYFAISLGQLFKDHRILFAVLFYIAIEFVIGIVTSIITVSSMYATTTDTLLFTPFPILTVIELLLAVGYYFGTYYIMTKKLNLQ